MPRIAQELQLNAYPNRSAAPKREPFCWLEKEKLRVLAEVFTEGRKGSLNSARSVMLALSEIASDKQSETFKAATSYIAQRAGVAVKTAARSIKTFRQLGFIHVRNRTANGLKIANEYTLIRGKCRLRLNYPSLGKRPTIGLPIKEESNEESAEGTARKGKEIFVNGNEEKERAVKESRDDIIIDPKTDESFNTHKKEYEW